MKTIKSFILILSVVLFLLLGCTKHSCPTYSNAHDSLSVDPYIQLIHSDTTPYRPSTWEKAGAVLFALFVIQQSSK